MKTVCGVTPRFVKEMDLPEVSAASGGVGASTDSRLHVSTNVLRDLRSRGLCLLVDEVLHCDNLLLILSCDALVLQEM